NPGIAEDSQLAEVVNRRLEVIPGSVPALGAFPAGCRFRGRCAWEVEACSADPVVSHDEADHFFKCWNPTASVGGEKGELDVARCSTRTELPLSQCSGRRRLDRA